MVTGAVVFPTMTPFATDALVAVSEPWILAREDCTDSPIRQMSTTTAAVDPATHRSRPRFSRSRAARLAWNFAMARGSRRTALADGGSTSCWVVRKSSTLYSLSGFQARYAATASNTTSRRMSIQ